ncbi:MAG: Flp pilus assembly complex ATPase component TadA, partial [Pseudomonadales bacterium]|nr:Flp pilus assembly complex ATPase component TadA [Pseudomonadales bacterium]
AASDVYKRQVLSTLHTNSAASTVTRLLEIGVEPYLVTSTLLGVLAQRLVRCNCPHCLEKEQVDSSIRELLGASDNDTFYRGKGCARCHNSGVHGRRAVYELLSITQDMKTLIKPGVSSQLLQQQAIKNGMTPLTEQALTLAKQKTISLSEVYRVRLS